MSTTVVPGQQLMLQIRAGFVAQGTSFKSWCERQGIDRGNARSAIFGSWNGPKAQRLRTKIIQAAKLDVSLARAA